MALPIAYHTVSPCTILSTLISYEWIPVEGYNNKWGKVSKQFLSPVMLSRVWIMMHTMRFELIYRTKKFRRLSYEIMFIYILSPVTQENMSFSKFWYLTQNITCKVFKAVRKELVSMYTLGFILRKVSVKITHCRTLYILEMLIYFKINSKELNNI